MIYGVDVSKWNGNINWVALKATGHCQFAVIKVSQGSTVDPKFLTNLAACKAYKIPYAFYVFGANATISGAQEEAKYALSLIAGSSPLFVAYDAESAALAAQTKSQTTAIANAFLTAIKSAGYVPYVYTNKSWSLNEIDVQFLKNKGYGFWYALYNGSTPQTANMSGSCDIWQYSDNGKLAGNGSSAIDLDVCYNASIIAKCGAEVNPNYCDTPSLTLCPGMVYQFKTGSPITCASGAFQQIAHSMENGYHFTKFRASLLTPGVGFYVNGKRACIGIIKTPYCDTKKFEKHTGEVYQFKTDFPITSGNKAIWIQQGNSLREGNYYLTKFKASGKGSGGFYCGSTCVSVGTVV